MWSTYIVLTWLYSYFWKYNLHQTEKESFSDIWCDDTIYSVTHMDSYRSKWVFWALFKGLETCPSRFIMGSTVHFIFWKNVQTKWIFKFWPYFQKIPMQKYKKLENWQSNFPNFIPGIKMYALCDNRNVFENSL